MPFLPVLQSIKRLLPCLLGVLPLLGLACGLTYAPGPPKTPEPVPINTRSLLLKAKDLPRLSSKSQWLADSYDLSDGWAEVKPVGAVAVTFYETMGSEYYDYVYDYVVREDIVRMQDAIEGRRLWEYLKHRPIYKTDLNDFKEDIALPSVNELPPLHADQVAIVCDDYNSWPGDPCAAHLQYKMFYVTLETNIDSVGMTSEKFYEIVTAADEAMRPIWENWPMPTPQSPLATPHKPKQ